ncbi:Protein kinesin light chain-related 1 [Vitis vinifera]|uniref:Protein kinesin light chain-related 1 n=1 Tax=Vitis vinifera TaxID=29760 RepID=A0A438FVD9_VITVI|nr:Protein kinesin light chain-related 1 [Vitis vinifera]
MLMRRNVVCRTAMINVYGKEKDFVGDVEFVFQMLVSADEVQLNATTMVCLHSACSTLCNYGVGRDVEKAWRIFDGVSYKKLPPWNAIITGYVGIVTWERSSSVLGLNGLELNVILVTAVMERTGVQPSDVTFIGVLSACNHSGLDGHVEEAYELDQNTIIPPDSIIWGALLCAGCIHRNLEPTDTISETIMVLQDPNLQEGGRMRRQVKRKGSKGLLVVVGLKLMVLFTALVCAKFWFLMEGLIDSADRRRHNGEPLAIEMWKKRLKVSDFIRILQTNLCIQPMEMTTRIPKQQRSDQYQIPIVGCDELVNCKELGDVNPGCPALQLTGILLESNLPRQKAILASGFDPLPLNGVYDQGDYEMGSLGEYLTGGIHSWDSMHMMLVDMVEIESSNFLGLDMANDKSQAGGKPQVLSVYSNLVKAFVNAHTAKGNKQVGQCIWGVLHKKIFKAKEYPKDEAALAKGESKEIGEAEDEIANDTLLQEFKLPFAEKKLTSIRSGNGQVIMGLGNVDLRMSNEPSTDPEIEEALRTAGLLSDSSPNSPHQEAKDLNDEDDLLKENREGLDNTFEMDSHLELDIYGDFEYDLEEPANTSSIQPACASGPLLLTNRLVRCARLHSDLNCSSNDASMDITFLSWEGIREFVKKKHVSFQCQLASRLSYALKRSFWTKDIELKQEEWENHPTVASVVVRLADLYNKVGKLRESKSYYENALRFYGKPNPGIPQKRLPAV